MLLLGVQLVQAVSAERQRKSRHFALAAIQAAIDGDPASSHELFRRAYETDPSNLSAAYSLALGEIAISEGTDSLRMVQALDMLRNYVDTYPADSDEGEYYAYICSLWGDFPEASRVVSRIYSLYPDKTDLLINLAGYHMQMNEFDSVLAYYDRYETAEGFSNELSLRKTLVHIMKHDTIAALTEASKGIRLNPRAPEGYLMKGTVIPYIGYPDSALHYLKKAEEIDPASGAVKLTLASYYEEKGDSAAYTNTVYEALLLDDLDLEQKLELLSGYVGPILEGKGDMTRADYLFSTLRNQYPHEAKIQDFAARYSYAKHDFDDAAEQIGFAIDMDPENESYRLQQLTYLIAGNRAEEAVTAYEALPASMNSNLAALYMGAAAYTTAKRPKDAIKAAHRMLDEISPGQMPSDTLTPAAVKGFNYKQLSILSDTYTLIGDTYYTMHDLPATYLAYENALVANPENVAALNNYAYFLAVNGGDLDKSQEMSHQAITLEPGNPTYIDTYAWILFKKGEYKEALDYQKSALENMDPQSPSAEYYEHMGDIYFMTGDPQSALQMWEKALPLDPENELLEKKIRHKTYFYE